ncbi:MAG: class I SAM-dependent methyltransferase [Deltaproteobacteria bacterium]|nr:class I SAM-dependent methyltransferase [Deltaproteobacteria bacterium]
MKCIRAFEGKHNSEINEKFHQLTLGSIGRVVYWKHFLDLAKKVPGDIVECGVGRGRSLLIMSALNYLLDEEEGGQRSIYAYDSFAGFPAPTKEDESMRQPKKGEWSHSPSGEYQYSPEFIAQVLRSSGIPLDDMNLTINKGFFCDSLRNHPARPIAILHVDCDLYQSYMDVLNSLYNLVVPNGVIIFDDVVDGIDEFSEKFPGARKALREFFGEKITEFQTSIAGSYFYIKKTSCLKEQYLTS